MHLSGQSHRKVSSRGGNQAEVSKHHSSFFFFFKPDPFPLYSTACSLKLLFLPLNVDLSSAFSALQHHYHITIITTLIILASAQQINKCFFLALHYCKSNGGENCCSPEHA